MKRSINLKIVVLSMSIMAVFGVVAIPSTVFARCETSAGDAKCVEDNYNAANKAAGGTLTPAQFQDAVDYCDQTRSVGHATRGYTFTLGTEQGNCSNAIRSCYEAAIDQAGCDNGALAAIISTCNNGNVGANAPPSNPNCGVNEAIDKFNEYDNGDTDYDTNGMVQERRREDALEVCNDASVYKTTQARKACQDAINKQVDACYAQNGGTGGRFLDPAYSSCMLNQAGDETQCEAQGGQWNANVQGPGAKQCRPPAPAPNDPNNTNDPNNSTPSPAYDPSGLGQGTTLPDPENKCGVKGEADGKEGGEEIKTNILSCEGEGEASFQDVLKQIVGILSVLVGILAVGGIAYGGVLYASASDNEGNTKKAIEIIRNTVIGLVVYAFMVALANWLIGNEVIK